MNVPVEDALRPEVSNGAPAAMPPAPDAPMPPAPDAVLPPPAATPPTPACTKVPAHSPMQTSSHVSSASSESLVAAIPAGPRLPPLPEIGLDEHAYATMARIADEKGDRHAREAAKVGLYITLALRPKMKWHDKLRHFTHALNKHCHVEKLADHRLWKFYHALAVLVKENCGAEALKLASHEDDIYAARLSIGIARADIERDAAGFFDELIGNGKVCPEYMLVDDFTMIRMIRDQWV